jgi:tRNA uridine 5-carbamoylmethylation protein Kti12
MKLIKLPKDGPAVKASSILSVDSVWYHNGWRYQIVYEILGEKEKYMVCLAVANKDDAQMTRDYFLETLNELL